MHAGSVEDLQRGRFRLEVVSVSRGRCLHRPFPQRAGPGNRDALAADLSDLPTADGHAVAAQLSFPPLLPESAHVTRTPRVLPTVISL